MTRSTSPTSSALVFQRILLPRPLAPEAVLGLLARLASDPGSPRLVLETRTQPRQRSDEGGEPLTGTTWFFVGVNPAGLDQIRRLMDAYLPGSQLLAVPTTRRARLRVARRVEFLPHTLPLRTDQPGETVRAILTALDATRPGETTVVQVLLGTRIPGHYLPATMPDPTQSLPSRLTSGVRPAGREIHRAITSRHLTGGFQIEVRIGVTAPPGRATHLGRSLEGALSVVRAPGGRIRLRPCPPELLASGQPRQRGHHLAPAELLGLLAWPLEDHWYPGAAPLHPRLLLPRRPIRPGGRAIGRVVGTGDAAGVDAAGGLMHQITTGPTGSGKSTVLLHQIRADAEAGRALLVLDPKRQLIDDVLDRAIPLARADDVVLLDPADPRLPGFNPLDAQGRDPAVVADCLLAVLRGVFADGWGPRTEDILMACLVTLCTAGNDRGVPYSLVDLPRLLTDDRFRTSVLAQIHHVSEVLASFWASYQEQSPAARAAIIAAPMNKLRRILLRPTAIRMLGGTPTHAAGETSQPTIRLRELFTRRQIVLVPLNDSLIGEGTASLLGSLVVAEAWLAAQERAHDQQPTARPGVVVVDECQRFLHLPLSLADALSQSRSYGVGWSLAHQHRTQLPRELQAGIDANARTKIVFRPESPADARDYAALTTGEPVPLEPADFLALPRWHAYARTITGGESSGWHLFHTAAPPEPTGHRDHLLHRIHQQAATTTDTTPPRATAGAGDCAATTPEAPSRTASSTPPRAPTSPAVLGRKKRRPTPTPSRGERGTS